jgi:HEAT repeats/Armadillo/beta-catenin-like repeat
MHRIERFARRQPAGTAAMAGLALLLLPATLLPRAHRAGEGEPTAVQSAPDAPQGGEARAVLSAVRGISPVACELAVQSAGNGWGWGQGDAEDAPAVGRSTEETRRVLAWLGQRTATSEDVASLRDGLGDPDACVRRMAARILAGDHVPGGVDALLEALRSGDAGRREAAILGLGYAGDARAVTPLIALLGDGDAEVRGGAAWALGHTESHDAAVAVARLTRDGEARVRRAAARALGRLEDGTSVPALAQLLASDPDPTVRRAAAWALGKIE